ncbi:MAG: 4Fe-4S binding protein [Dehalococcoidia bacterium]|nr:MAG: 4Fe-4S binding protein [Dehalococcoidia bacterium]
MEVLIDTQTCSNPLNCYLCLERCPEKVFGTQPRTPRQPGALAQDWVIFPVFASQCTGCLECIEFCPRRAITVLPQSNYRKLRALLSLIREILFGKKTAWSWK